MTQFEFISRLRRCLSGLPEEEIDRAVEYYEDYFADAGVSDEEVIAKLGDPEEIAETIRQEISGRNESETEGIFTERGFETEQDREDFLQPDKFTQVVNMQGTYRDANGSEGSEHQQNGSYGNSGHYDSYANQNQGEYYYNDKKERKKNRNFFVTLLIVFGSIWLVLILLIIAVYIFFSKHHTERVTYETHTESMESSDKLLSSEETILTEGEFVLEEEITGLQIKAEQSEVSIETGDKFSIKITKNSGSRAVKSRVKNGIWRLEETDGHDMDLKELLKHFSDGGIHIVVTVPEDFEAEKMEIDVEAGKVEAEVLVAEKAEFEVDAGMIKIGKLAVTKEAKMEIGLGSIDISEGNVHDLQMECDMGKAFFEGILTGKNEIKCDMGAVECRLENSQEDYTFLLKNDMGSIDINGEVYSGMDSKAEIGNGDSKVEIKVNMGSVLVKTEE